MATAPVTARVDESPPIINLLLAHLSTGLMLLALGLGVIYDVVEKAERYTAMENATIFWLLSWGSGTWAALFWVWAVLALVPRFHKPRVLRRVIPALLPAPALLALQLHWWPMISTGTSWG